MGVEAYICLACMLVFGVYAIMSNKMIASAIFLALASLAVGILMAMMGAVWAAVFEISVCSGLVTIIFICALGLSKDKDGLIPSEDQDKNRMKLLPVLLIGAGIVLIVLAMGLHINIAQDAVAPAEDVGEVLWNSRQPDIWGQMVVLTIGAAAIAVFFKERVQRDS